MSELSEQIYALHRQGLRNRSIARRLGCHESTVSKSLRDKGVEPGHYVTRRDEYLAGEGAKRNLTKRQLMARLMRTISEDRLVASILDDGVV